MNILVAYDGTEPAQSALRTAGEWARHLGARVIIAASMVGGPDVPRKDFVTIENYLSLAQIELEEQGIACEQRFSVRGLEAGEDLAQLCKETGCDLLVVGIQKRSRVGKLVFGSTAQYLILNAPCPVLTVK